MESSCEVGHVNISEATYALVKEVRKEGSEEGESTRNPQPAAAGKPATLQPATAPAFTFTFTPRGTVLAKGKGEMEMYFVERCWPE